MHLPSDLEEEIRGKPFVKKRANISQNSVLKIIFFPFRLSLTFYNILSLGIIVTFLFSLFIFVFLPSLSFFLWGTR
jgi:hypothetical protein